MKTTIVPLIGDPRETLYQLGQREREDFKKIEERITRLLSTSLVLRLGQDMISRMRFLMRKKKPEGLFDSCIKAYAEGLGIDPSRYLSFLSLFEIAAHFGHVYPELKGLLPGCTSVLARGPEGFTHDRLLDFPLLGTFDSAPRLYYWQREGAPPLLSYSTPGLAPLFFQGIHGSGVSFALHHKPGKTYHQEGESIFQIAFETFLEGENFTDIRKIFRQKTSMTKWGVVLLDKTGAAHVIDIDGPSQNQESYHLNESSPLIFTNVPMVQDDQGFESFIRFSRERQSWVKSKLSKPQKTHPLDLLTEVNPESEKGLKLPAATFSTIAAWSVNLTQGYVDVKEGTAPLVASDPILRFSLASQGPGEVLKKTSSPSPFEAAWKRAGMAQSLFDQGKYDEAYHELQMSLSLMPNPQWKEILEFFLVVWDFKFVSNSKELSLVYKRLKKLHPPEILRDELNLLIMRFEKRLDLSSTVDADDLPPHLRNLFRQEKLAPKPLFATWVKLLYPRLDVLAVFSPHQSKGL
jgi:hypothetical protein